MTPPIINISVLDYHVSPVPLPPILEEKYQGARLGDIGRRLGAEKLGYNVTILPPGKRAFPCHSHRINEEMFFMLEGSGEVRIGSERYPITQGDVIACPPGGPETAHQIVNTSGKDLKYLAVSTRLSPDIADYPDSGKFGVLAELGKAPDGSPQMFRFIGRTDGSLSYWDGES